MNIIKFGANISRLRKERDMPQSKLADILNVTRQAVSKWERGEGFPDITILCEIANVFETSVDDLINTGGAIEIGAEIKDKDAIQDIINIAPYLKVSTLSAIAEQLSKHNIDISKIVELSEFMNDESIIKLFQSSSLENLDDALLEKIIPFLDQNSLSVVLERVINGQNSAKLPLWDYIDRSLIEAAGMQGMLNYNSPGATGESNGKDDIILKNIYKIYPGIYTGDGKDLVAVTDFNLEIKKGEVIVFVGPSGCGKTSVLRMIAGLEEITKGGLYIDGRLMNGAAPADRGLAMVFQNYALFPHMTVFENIAVGLKPEILPGAEIKERIGEIARILDVVHLLDRKPDQLAAGQKHRVSLARAMVRKNKIILLDEPLANLDAKLRIWVRTELIKLHKKYDSTFIYVTHNQDDALAIADRIVIMKDGMIQQVGTPEELYFKPRNLFVAGFIGSPQMNFMEKMNFWDLEKKIDGKTVIAGVRPEDMYIDAAGEIDAIVEIREFLGDNIHLQCKTENNIFKIYVPHDCTAKPGDKIKIAVNPNKIYLFDKETELAI